MQLNNDNETTGFSFVWTIHNFSYCEQKTAESIQSPDFALDFDNNSKWRLELFPRGLQNSDSVGFCVLLKYAINSLRVSYVLSVRNVKGTFTKMVDKEDTFSSGTGFLSPFLTLQEIHKRGTEAYLDNDTLIVRFRISEVDSKILESKQCYARTTIGVERVTYNWNSDTLSNLRKKLRKQTKFSDISSFTMDFYLFKNNFKVLIERTNTNKLNFSTCVISLLDAENILYSKQYEHWFEKLAKKPIWKINFPRKYDFLTLTTRSSNISLRCEFAISFGVESSKIEKTEYGMELPLVCSTQTIKYDVPGSWRENLRCFCSEGKLSDLIIRTPTKDFPVHKFMLCAQSAVFSAMFERDMKENRSGMIHIEDLDDEAVSMMLLFVYTGIVENLNWKMASKLYYAADKYEMTGLKENCSVFLKDNLSTSNACKYLILADLHQDQGLKSVTQDFIIKHATDTDIINSDEWKEFMKEKVQLAAETMHLLCMQNLKN